MLKTLTIALLVVGFIGLLIGQQVVSQQETSAKTEDSLPAAKYSFEADDLARYFIEHRNAAAVRFLHEFVEVKGMIIENPGPSHYLMFTTESIPNRIGARLNLEIIFTGSNLRGKKLEMNQIITVRGRCKGIEPFGPKEVLGERVPVIEIDECHLVGDDYEFTNN